MWASRHQTAIQSRHFKTLPREVRKKITIDWYKNRLRMLQRYIKEVPDQREKMAYAHAYAVAEQKLFDIEQNDGPYNTYFPPVKA